MTNDELRAVIFDIQAFSVHDGPGCRTTIFFAGCPLRCRWCSNPENFVVRPHLMFAQRVCKWASGCRACTQRCPHGGLTFTENGPVVSWEICRKCTTFECTSACAANALRVCGKEYSVGDVMTVLKRDFNNWGSEGGVTFSGGDPLLQPHFLKAVLQECKKLQIHTAIETSACVPESTFLDVMPLVDFAFIDVKNMDDERHKDGTFVSNQQILRNIAALKANDWPGRLVLRYPVIHDYNDSEANARQLIAFMQENGLFEVNLLKFHRLGQTKWEQLGLEYAYATGGNVSDEHLQKLQSLYLDHDILCYIGDKTPF